MIIKIIYTRDRKFIPKRRFLFWWYKISKFEFTYHKVCINWICKTYIPKQKKSRTAKLYKKSEKYCFIPEYRDKIDIDFM
jgi:hypothetical protein